MQDSFLLDTFSIAENLLIKRYPHKKLIPFIDKAEINNIASRVLKELDINFDQRIKLNKLSKEDKKIIEIARIYFHNPDVIIMHEPIENLRTKSLSCFQH